MSGPAARRKPVARRKPAAKLKPPAKVTATFSITTLERVRELLDAIQLPSTWPNFEQVAADIAKARREVAAALPNPEEAP